ncbi:hypothetical protein KSP40_PGU019837 [Platanthera guangdongensis]|uniref:MATH domain-containing protein n=1 Tax=Platanthera guangdongensis TaxID=2320717 RepID=A0ABR2MBF3_9ASPA
MYYHGSIHDTSAMNVSVEFSLSIIDQIEGNHKKRTYTEVFKCSPPGRGWKDCIPLKDFNDAALGFIVNDTCIIVARVAVLALVVLTADPWLPSGCKVCWSLLEQVDSQSPLVSWTWSCVTNPGLLPRSPTSPVHADCFWSSLSSVSRLGSSSRLEVCADWELCLQVSAVWWQCLVVRQCCVCHPYGLMLVFSAWRTGSSSAYADWFFPPLRIEAS